MNAPSHALPGFLTVCPHSKNPRENGRFSCDIPRCGRSQLRKSDQTLPGYAQALHKTRLPLQLWPTRLVHGARTYERIPSRQASRHTVLVRRHTCPWTKGVCSEGLKGLLLHLGPLIAHHLPAPWHPQPTR